MKIHSNYSTISFNGYKNLLVGGIDNSNRALLYISGELNNEGSKDLDTYKKVTEILPQYKGNNNNCFTLLYAKRPKIEILVLNQELIPDCEDLHLMQNKLSQAAYQQKEGGILKAYTLFADITKRITKGEFGIKDKNIVDSIKSARNSIENALGNNEYAHNLFLLCNLDEPRYEKWASYINGYISRTMMKFFK